MFRIARRVAKDRVISTVDPDTRHGHKTSARGFDGYKGHAAVDPDSEIITATTVTPGNAGDASVAEDLIADLLDDDVTGTAATPSSCQRRHPPTARSREPDTAAWSTTCRDAPTGPRVQSRRALVAARGVPTALRNTRSTHSAERDAAVGR